jgi:hypothetical protein
VPMEKNNEFEKLPRTMPRLPKGKNIFTNFLDACREGKCDTAASFEYGAQLTEFTLLGNLAQHAAVGHKVEWDGPGMKVTNLKDLNKWIKCPHRKGWPA